jgi:hypothetical protein
MARVLRCIASRFPQHPPAGQLDLPLHLRVVATCLPRRRLPPRPARPPATQHAVQLVIAYPSRPRRHRPVNPHAAANALALQHRDIAQTVAANISRRTGHPRDDLEQIAMIGILQAARRYTPERGTFRPYARTYANGEVYHYLRDKGFLIKVPASWRELHARGQKLLRLGYCVNKMLNSIGISQDRWEEISLACMTKICQLDEWETIDNGTR